MNNSQISNILNNLSTKWMQIMKRNFAEEDKQKQVHEKILNVVKCGL